RAPPPRPDAGGAEALRGAAYARKPEEHTMNINKYTEKAQEAVLRSQQLAEEMSHPLIEPEHLLVALVEQREGVVPEVLRKMSADPVQIARDARELLGKVPQAYGGAQPGLSPRLKTVADTAQREADRLKDEYVSTEHL